MQNKLFCTFTDENSYELVSNTLRKNYNVLNNKIFVIKDVSSSAFYCTYNLDTNNLGAFPKDTILVHRKKETNTLYTINALNAVIRVKNNGILNKRFEIDWKEFKNSLLLVEGDGYRKVDTVLHLVLTF